MDKKLKIVRFNGEIYVRVSDVEDWLAERALDLADPELGQPGVAAVLVTKALRTRFSRIFSSLPNKSDDVMIRPKF